MIGNIPKYSKLFSITKVYPEKIKHIGLKHRIIASGFEKEKPRKLDVNVSPEMRKAMDEDNLERSLRRTQAEIADIIDCNEFEWFGTFTFAPDQVANRYDDDEIYAKMSKWFNNERRRSPELHYLLVPERHKDGALHFHALLGHFNGSMSDSGRKYAKQPIYNAIGFKYGFTNFTRIRDKARTANYCRKYITKELMQEKGKRRYWASKNLSKPQRVENLRLDEAISRYNADVRKLIHYENDYIIANTFTLKGNAPKNPEGGGFSSNA